MTSVITEQRAENMAHVRRLLRRKQPGFAAALDLAVVLAALELCTPDIPLKAPDFRRTDAHATGIRAPLDHPADIYEG